MLYHCGLLDKRPEESRTLQWIRNYRWEHLPDDVRRELRIWLAMPGFSKGWNIHHLGASYLTIVTEMGYFDQYREDVAANWLSATREDCVKLSRMRPGTGHIPDISVFRMLQDLKEGRVLKEVAMEYRVTPNHLWRLQRGTGPVPPLPDFAAKLGSL